MHSRSQWIRYPGIVLGESYNGIRVLADFIRDVTKYQHLCVCNKDSERCNMTDHALQKQKKKISDISSGVSGQMFGQSGESVTEENNTQVIQIFSHTSKYPRQFNSN